MPHNSQRLYNTVVLSFFSETPKRKTETVQSPLRDTSKIGTDIKSAWHETAAGKRKTSTKAHQIVFTKERRMDSFDWVSDGRNWTAMKREDGIPEWMEMSSLDPRSIDRQKTQLWRSKEQAKEWGKMCGVFLFLKHVFNVSGSFFFSRGAWSFS